MKKILLILISFYSLGFSGYIDTQYINFVNDLTNPRNNLYNVTSGVSYDTWKVSLNSTVNKYTIKGTYYSIRKNAFPDSSTPDCSLFPELVTADDNYICKNGTYEPFNNPDGSDDYRCDDLFLKDGVAYTCNPNTNEATPIPNSNGLIPDPEDPDVNIPNCNEGYEHTSLPTITIGADDLSYNQWGCAASDSSGGDNAGGGDTGTSNPNLDNTTSNDNGDGTTTVTFPDGSTQTYNTGDTSTPISSTPATNGGGQGVGGSDGYGGSGTPTNENNPNTSDGTGDENDLTPPSVATVCNDTNMTLEQKMLCELNEGMKNQNSESDPTNSLNNLLKDLVANNIKDNTAINTNIKGLKENTVITNSRLTAVNSNLSALKTINQQIVSNGNKTNEELEKINNVETPTDTEIKLEDEKSTLDTLVNEFTEFSTTLTSSIDSVKTLSVEAQSTINQGFSLNNLKGLGEVTSCPYTFELSFNGSTQFVQTDVCIVTSKFYFVFYPISFMVLLFGVIRIAIFVLRSV